MIALTLLLALGAQPAAPPSAVVVPLHVTGLSANESMGLALQIHQILTASGVPLSTDPASALVQLGAQTTAASACKAEPDCAASLARRLSVMALIGVDAAAGRKACTLHVEAVSAADGSKLGVLDLTSPREGLLPENKAELQAFALALAPKLAAMAPPAAPKQPDPVPATATVPAPSTDLPREADLRPPAREAPPEIVVAKPSPAPSGARPAVIGTAVGAGIAAVAAVALGIVGYTEQSQLTTVDAAGHTTLTYGKAQEIAGRANTMYGSAGAAAGVAAVLATVAVVLQLAD